VTTKFTKIMKQSRATTGKRQSAIGDRFSFSSSGPLPLPHRLWPVVFRLSPLASIKRVIFLLGFFLLAVSVTGCAAKYVLETQSLQTPLQWPQQPNSAKVEYLTSISGFKETGTSFGYALRSVVFGADGDNRILKPVAVAAASDGRIAIADTAGKCVHLYIPKEKAYYRVYEAGGKDLKTPVGVTFDKESRLYVSDSSLAAIFVFDPHGKYLFSIDKAYFIKLKRPTGLAYNPDKDIIYAADTLEHRIYAFRPDGNVAFSFGERGIGNGQFNFPTHLFYSPRGFLYVTDSMNFRIQVFDPAGNFLAVFGHHGDGSGDMAMPKGIAADSDGIIYVVDALFDNVQLFNAKGQFLLTVSNRGVEQGEFWLPAGLFIDDSDRLYVCDTYNQRVQIFRITKNYVSGE
jgi:DNA-binding beta-propeller fold protein YncE